MSYEEKHPLNPITNERWCNVYGGLIRPGQTCEFCPPDDRVTMIYFCGYPVPDQNLRNRFKACGEPATPGHAFCDEHGKLFERDRRNVADSLANDTGHGPDPRPAPRPWWKRWFL